jgi:hypothetical protein
MFRHCPFHLIQSAKASRHRFSPAPRGDGRTDWSGSCSVVSVGNFRLANWRRGHAALWFSLREMRRRRRTADRLLRDTHLPNLRQQEAAAPDVAYGAPWQEPRRHEIRAGAGRARRTSEQLQPRRTATLTGQDLVTPAFQSEVIWTSGISSGSGMSSPSSSASSVPLKQTSPSSMISLIGVSIWP